MNITLKKYGIKLDISFEYQPYEPMTLEYPGTDEYIIIETIEYNGEDIIDIFSDDFIEKLENEILIKGCH